MCFARCKCKAYNAIGFEEHICFLRDLQDLRSSGTGHRKGANYNKIATKFGLNEKNTVDVFEDILNKTIAVLECLPDVRMTMNDCICAHAVHFHFIGVISSFTDLS